MFIIFELSRPYLSALIPYWLMRYLGSQAKTNLNLVKSHQVIHALQYDNKDYLSRKRYFDLLVRFLLETTIILEINYHLLIFC